MNEPFILLLPVYGNKELILVNITHGYGTLSV